MDTHQIERRLRVLEDIEAIRGLKTRYLASCDAKNPQGMRACFADGPVHIDYGAVGTFDRADALVKVFTELACHQHMVELHHGVNPQIEVLDENKAKGRWGLHYFLIDTKAKSLTQLGGYYEDEYRKVNGAWKISRTHFVVTSTLAMDVSEGAAKTLFAGRSPPA
ncbi:MAG: nuclear transport factor 2 family protein [Nevskiales bacterium]